ncbi:dienelactone hydrolase family protein [Dehalococcoidia bacterium]|nr:dienelactone hydrolase family protein [Dehalococcoidia bacterium]
MGVSVMEIRDNGLVASFCLPGTAGKHPGVIVLGGSEGGKDSTTAKLLAEQGYAALALAYFGVEQLPPKLEEIPLEYFKQAIDWMASNPSVESRRIGLIGTSKGGEAALLVSATYPEISAVVAYVPSDVVFQCLNFRRFGPPVEKSSWTLHGQPLPFVPYRPSFRLMWRHGFLLALANHLGGLQDQEAVERAIIPVERINGPILLISGKKDGLWPSSMMCERIVERLSQHNFPFPFEHLSYEDAGHIPPGTMEVLMEERRTRRRGLRLSFKNLFSLLFIRAGGTKTGNAFAIDDAWAKTCAFLEQHLKR